MYKIMVYSKIQTTSINVGWVEPKNDHKHSIRKPQPPTTQKYHLYAVPHKMKCAPAYPLNPNFINIMLRGRC